MKTSPVSTGRYPKSESTDIQNRPSDFGAGRFFSCAHVNHFAYVADVDAFWGGFETVVVQMAQVRGQLPHFRVGCGAASIARLS